MGGTFGVGKANEMKSPVQTEYRPSRGELQSTHAIKRKSRYLLPPRYNEVTFDFGPLVRVPFMIPSPKPSASS